METSVFAEILSVSYGYSGSERERDSYLVVAVEVSFLQAYRFVKLLEREIKDFEVSDLIDGLVLPLYCSLSNEKDSWWNGVVNSVGEIGANYLEQGISREIDREELLRIVSFSAKTRFTISGNSVAWGLLLLNESISCEIIKAIRGCFLEDLSAFV